MCKVIAFSNASKIDVRKASEAIGKILLGLERDGYGYAVKGSQNIFGEKCIAPYFQSRLSESNVVPLPIVQQRQSTFGHADKPTGPAIFHGRTSTNDKGLRNCHPMQRDGWHLIHNGVVTDHGEAYQTTTTNDSEHVLWRLMQGIEHVEKHLTGYYAFAAIAPDGRLHVCRDDNATLFVALAPKIGSYIFATTESLLRDVAKALKIKIGPIDAVENNVYMIFNVQGDALEHKQAIKPRGFERREAVHATASLGRSLYAIDSDGDSYQHVESIVDYAGIDDDSDDSDLTELMQELSDLDDENYRIIGPDGEPISAAAFYKLDEISQNVCRIERADGSTLDCEALWHRAR